MKAEIITIGDEILIGQITDTNSKWMAERLNEIGIEVHQITSVHDDREHILKAIREAEAESDLILLTGGLGPTKDDITKNTLIEYFDDELILYPEIVEHIKHLFAKIKYKFTEKDIAQAMLPAKAKVLKNFYGTAAGMWFEKGQKIIVSMPGVPNEMKGLMSDYVIPQVREMFHLPFIIHRTIQTYGLGESRVAERLENWEDNLPSFIKLAYLPSYGKLRLRMSARGWDKAVLEQGLQQEIEKLNGLISDIIVGFDQQETIEVVLNRMFSESKSTLSLAESCTGGSIASRLTVVPGASAFLRGGVVAYSAKAKMDVLGVSEETIHAHTVVSEEVAKEMALKCKELFGSDYAIATTGNAGPTRDETDKSVGVVFIAIASPSGVFAEEFFFGKPREKVIERASVKALEMLRREFLKNQKNSLFD
jgi:nicotinamide-nucleotide amidase